MRRRIAAHAYLPPAPFAHSPYPLSAYRSPFPLPFAPAPAPRRAAQVKEHLHAILSEDREVDEEMITALAPTRASSLTRSLIALGNPVQALHRLYTQVETLTAQLKKCVSLWRQGLAEFILYDNESILLMYKRWRKLERDLYSARKDRFDISKVCGCGS